MNSKNALTKKDNSQSLQNQSELEQALQLASKVTGEVIKKVEENPYTSTGKSKSKIYGAAGLTNKLKEEGIEAHKKGIVPEANMNGGLQNRQINAAANGGLNTLELLKNQNKSLPEKK